MNRRLRVVLTVLAVPLALAACSPGDGGGIASAGGTSPSATGVEEVSEEERAFQFVECMRENGIDLPDPEPDGEGGFTFGIGELGIDLSDARFQDALRACRDKLPRGGDRDLDDPEVQAQLREFAECMRDNGIDMPDPDPGGGFGGAMAEIDRNSPAFQKALEACRDLLQGVR